MATLPPLDLNKFKLPALDVSKFKIPDVTATPSVPKAPGILGTIKNAAGAVGDVLKKDVSQFVDESKASAQRVKEGKETIGTNIVAGAVRGPGILAGNLNEAIGKGISSIFGAALTPQAKEALSKTFSDPKAFNNVVANDPIVSQIVKNYQDWAKEHPTEAQMFKNVANIGMALPIVEQGTELAQGAVGLAKTAATGAKEAVGEAIPGIQGAKEAVADIKGKIIPEPNAAQQAEKIQETISPKPTAKEAKLATDQGRLVKGKEPGLFTKGEPDTVLPTKQQARATNLIQERIPGAYKMTEPELNTALKSEGSKIAKEITPDMQKTPIKVETVKKLNTDMIDLQKKQLKGVYTTDEIKSVKGMQKDFSERIRKFMRGGNLNDLWQEAIDYDASIPDNVKQANDLSSDALQRQRQTWIENRSVMRKTLTDSKAGLGKKAEKAFQDMSDFYDAREGILSKAKIETKTLTGKIPGLIKKHPIISGAVSAGTYEVLKKSGLPLP